MTSLEQFKQVRMTVAPELQQELFKLMTSNPDDAISRMVKAHTPSDRKMLRQIHRCERILPCKQLPKEIML